LFDQVRQALDNVKSVIQAAGLTVDHVVYVQVYLQDVSNYSELNEVFAAYFSKVPPARAVLGVRISRANYRSRGTRFDLQTSDFGNGSTCQ
jgi:enamine deaminase RidA (YjgF/YER057c/UK114 family)